jgi:hypothetical protein
MSTPDVSLTIRDPGLGITPANAGKVQVKAGVCSKAAPNVLQGFGSVNAAKEALGAGPLLDCVVAALDVGGGPVLAMPILVTAQGTVTGAFTLTGSGTATVTGSKAPREAIAVKIVLGGTLTTMTFQVKVGSGAYGSTITSGAGPYTYQVPGDYFTNLIFSAGTYVTNDIYTVGTDGVVVRTGSGTATLLDTSTFSPVDAYSIRVVVTTAGAPGTGAFKLSMDGGKHYSASIGIPASGKYVVPDTGVVLTFAGTFVLADVYTGTSTPAGYTTTEVNTALTALLADSTDWGWVHLVGQPASAAAAASMAIAVDAHMTAAQTAFRYVFAVIECPYAEGDAAIKAAFVSFVSPRICVVVGDTDIYSRLTSRTDKRSFAWAMTARLGAIRLSENPAKVKTGRLANVEGIYRDERATPGLDDARFTTSRTFIGKPGYFVNNFKMMASPGWDFSRGMNRRVMDRICQLARVAYLEYVNSEVNIDRTTGYIDSGDAQAIDANVKQYIRAGIAGDVSSVDAVLSRTDNLLSTSTVNAEVNAIPKGYFENINVSIGFVNPVLQAAAA